MYTYIYISFGDLTHDKGFQLPTVLTPSLMWPHVYVQKLGTLKSQSFYSHFPH